MSRIGQAAAEQANIPCGTAMIQEALQVAVVRHFQGEGRGLALQDGGCVSGYYLKDEAGKKIHPSLG